MVFSNIITRLRTHQSAVWYLAIIVICLTAFITSMWASNKFFQHVPHSEDEAAYLFQANIFAMGRLTVPQPENANAFWSPFVVSYNHQRFGKYPPGWPLLLAVGYLLNMPWLINALLGVAILWLVAYLGRLLYRQPIGLMAAGLGLTTPVFLVMSSSFWSHNASLFWVGLFFIGYFRLLLGHHWANGLLAGLSLGMVFLTRPFAALGISVPLLLYLGFIRAKAILLDKTSFRIGLDFALLGLGAALIATCLPLYWWAVSSEWGFNAYTLVWEYDRPGFGPNAGLGGYYLHNAKANLRFNLTAVANGTFGWPGWTNLLFIPLVFLLRVRQPIPAIAQREPEYPLNKANLFDWLLLSSVINLIITYLFYWQYGGHDGGFPRYYYDGLISLLLLTVRGIQLLSLKLGQGFAINPEKVGDYWLGRLFPYFLLIIFISYNIFYTLPSALSAYYQRYGISSAPIEAVTEADLDNALVWITNYNSWSDFAAPFAANSPVLDGPVVFAIAYHNQFNPLITQQFAGRSCWVWFEEALMRCTDYRKIR